MACWYSDYYLCCYPDHSSTTEVYKISAGEERKAENARTLGEVIKQHRVDCKMTQEFVAEILGVSRQAISKWENGVSDPSTTNVRALAKLFDIEAEELLKEAK